MKENDNLSLTDLNNSAILRENESLLNLLLKDHTTGKNIKWGTDSYINHGYSFRDDQEIKIDLITGWYEGFIRPRVDKEIDIQLERQRNKAEVFTPSWVIKLQVDAALEDMEELPLVDFIKTKWLEITCGEAPYMVNRYDMETGEVIPLKERSGFIDVKFKKLNQEIESEEEWLKLAVKIYKASYGYEYQGDSLLLARENLILTFIDNYFYMFGAFPKEKILLEITKIISLNVFQMDGLTYEIPYSVGNHEEIGTQLNLFEDVAVEENITPELAKIKLWQKNKFVEVKTMSERDDKSMKFDVVIGNPPYQKLASGNNTAGLPIYPEFMNNAYELAEKTILITPSRFLFNAGQTSKKWNEDMLNDKHFKVLEYYQNASDIFTNTSITGGVAITYRDTSKILGPVDIFIPYKELEMIIKKVTQTDNGFESIQSIIYTQSKFDLNKLYIDFPEYKKIIGSKGKDRRFRNNIFDKIPLFQDQPTKNNDLRVLGLKDRERIYQYIPMCYVEKENWVNKYKVFVPLANGASGMISNEPARIISTPVLGYPGEGFTQTFIGFGMFNSEKEAKALLKYIKTKFVRILLGALKVTQGNPKSTWKFIPIQNFSDDSDINWNDSINDIDKQLFDKYKLNIKETDFINNHIKEME